MLYDRSITQLLTEAITEMADVFGREDLEAWFSVRYPRVKRSSLHAHIVSATVNNRSRRHHSANPDLVFRRPDGSFERYDPSRHGAWSKDGESLLLNKPYDYGGCQSLFGYAKKVHARSGGICQLCGYGGSGMDFDLWRQLSVEHLIGQSQGGYPPEILSAVAGRFPELSLAEQTQMVLRIDEANTITACSFCNSMTSRDRSPKTMAELLNEVEGGPEEVTAVVIQQLEVIRDRKHRDVTWKLEAIRVAFEREVAPALQQARSRAKVE